MLINTQDNGKMSSLLTKKQDTNMNEKHVEQQDPYSHLVDRLRIGDKVASDDYCAVGILTQVGYKLMVVGDFGSILYDYTNSDWQLYHVWQEKIDQRNKRVTTP